MASTRRTSQPPFGDRPGFLLHQLGVAGAAQLAERLAPLGLGPRQFELLSRLADAAGASQQRLADTMGLHRNQMVALVDELEARGLAERRRHPHDRRAHALFLTPAADELLSKAHQACDHHEADLLSCLSEAECRQLIALLQRLASHAAPELSSAHRSPTTTTGSTDSGAAQALGPDAVV